MRVFPLSNWSELDVWRYVARENLEVVPLYFTAERPVVERQGALIMVDDDRMVFEPGEQPQMRRVRFRSLGDYPLSGAIESEADDVYDIIRDIEVNRQSERAGRLIDGEGAQSMERKKAEGYF